MLDQEDVHPVLALALGDTDDVVVQVPVAPGSSADDDPWLAWARGRSRLPRSCRPSRFGYIYNPRKTVTLRAGDELLASGPEEGRERLARSADTPFPDEETGMVELSPAP